MSKPEIDFSSLDDLIEARIRFHLLKKVEPSKAIDTKRQGQALNEAGVVLLWAAFQGFVESVFLECSFKVFGRELVGEELDRYRKTWRIWGNPSSRNIRNLFRRLGIDDVFQGMPNDPVPRKDQNNIDFRELIDLINSVRNCIAHAKPIKHNEVAVDVNLSVLRAWRTEVQRASGRFKFHALHGSHVRSGA